MGFQLPAEYLEPESTDDPDLWPELFPVVLLFSRCLTQWRVGMGGVIGFDYQAVDLVAIRMNTPLNAQIFSDLQVMERAALSALHDKD